MTSNLFIFYNFIESIIILLNYIYFYDANKQKKRQVDFKKWKISENQNKIEEKRKVCE